MDLLFGLFWLGVAALVPIGVLVALVRVSQALRELRELRARVDALSTPAVPARPAPTTALARELQAAPTSPQAVPPPAPSPAPAPPPPAPPPAMKPPPPRAEVPPERTVADAPPPESAASDFATNLGPKILVVAGGLAVVIFVGLFVRYAWENNWVGPLGRVLSAAVFSSGLAAGGLRLMERRYRPVGQGLTAAGLAGLYVTAWAAHEVYGLVPREVAAGLLVVVTLAAVVVALRRDARLLAGLASVGGYLAPWLVSTGEDHAEILFTYLLLLGAGAAWLERRKPWREALLLGAGGTLVLYTAWCTDHFSAHRFGVAAIGLVLLSALYAFGKPRADAASPFLAAAAVFASGLGAALMAGAPERPWGPLALLAAVAQIALLAARRWPWTPAVAAALAPFAVLSWHDHFGATSGDLRALALGLGVAAAYIVPLTVSGMRSQAIGVPGALAHVFASLLASSMLNRVLADRPGPLFLATLALAALHLLLGLAVRGRDFDPLRARVTLGLAAVFLTVAIPVWFGLHATTLAWAGEGLLLLWLGVRQRSWLARGFGYAVLLLAVGRLFVRHAPLHADPFTPVLNPVFGTWLAVIVALALARRLARRVPEAERIAGMDDISALLLGPLALTLLFGLLTAETRSWFGQLAREARGSNDAEAELRAEREGDVAVSVLWTVFATALLSAGIALRSLPLFYTAYGLFALTAGKVVLVDLATLPTFYRMLSFLALGALLLAGAWLNLRFRERLEGRVVGSKP